jgi:NitT/TauT family transport system substrate-binding protein
VDAAVVWNPWVAQIEKSGKGKALFTSKDMPGLIPDLLVAQDKAIKAKRKDLVGMIRAWFDTEKFIRDNPDEAAKIMAKVVGMKPEEYKVFLPGTRFFDAAANQAAFNAADPNPCRRGPDHLSLPARQEADRRQARRGQGHRRLAAAEALGK